jgi:hypothetical protein
MWMCIYEYVHIYLWLHIYIFIYIYIFILKIKRNGKKSVYTNFINSLGIYVRVDLDVYVYVCVYLYLCVYIYKHDLEVQLKVQKNAKKSAYTKFINSLGIYVCVDVDMYIYVYMHIYIYFYRGSIKKSEECKEICIY